MFKHAGAEVIGVSSDSVESHQRFARDHHLPFTLLSDADGVVRKMYGVHSAFGLPGRVTYIINRQGIVHHVFSSQFTSKRHVDEALAMLQTIHAEQG